MTSFIEIGRIKVAPNRQRKKFDEAKLAELREGILANGLLQAIVLRVEGDDFFLVAGERRLRAITDIWELNGTFFHNSQAVFPGCIPYTTLGELPELEAREAEYEENAQREDLTWQEDAAATQELMTLRTMRAEREGKPAPTVAAIAQEVRGSAEGINHETTRKQLIVARYLQDEDVAKAPSLKEAMKVLQKKEQVAKNQQLAATVGQNFKASSHILHHGDSQSWLQGQLSDSFDVILTDPPYGMGADEFGDSGGKAEGAHFYADSPEVWNQIMSWFPGESFRISKPDAAAYVFCDPDKFLELRSRMDEAGWRCFRTPLIWFKPSAYRAPWPDAGPQRKYEFILYAVKGQRKVNHLAGDVLTYQPDTNLGHMAQKPVALYEDLLKRSARPGDQVLDPFAGTGPVIAASHALLCRATAIERDAAAYGIMCKRLTDIEHPEDLLTGLE